MLWSLKNDLFLTGCLRFHFFMLKMLQLDLIILFFHRLPKFFCPTSTWTVWHSSLLHGTWWTSCAFSLLRHGFLPYHYGFPRLSATLLLSLWSPWLLHAGFLSSKYIVVEVYETRDSSISPNGLERRGSYASQVFRQVAVEFSVAVLLEVFNLVKRNMTTPFQCLNMRIVRTADAMLIFFLQALLRN
jgi:hypothetical protein